MSRSTDTPSGRNSGSIVFAMNSTVMSGTPRTNSMKITENTRMIGSRERRPSAKRMPDGSEDREDHEEVDRAPGPLRRVEPQHPADADREEHEEDVDAPAQVCRIGA